MKCNLWYSFNDAASRAPYGARGLKLEHPKALGEVFQSRPVWGAWIEIQNERYHNITLLVAPRMGRVD